MPSGRALRMQLEAIEQSGGVQKLRQKLAEFAGAGRADDVMTVDLDKSMQGLGDFAATNNPRVYNDAAGKLNARQPDITERILGDMEAVVGKPLPDAIKRANELKSDKYDWANTAFQNLRTNVKAEFSPDDLGAYISKPTIAHALEQAQLADDIANGGALEKLLKRVQAGSRDPADMKAMAQIANTGKAQRPLTFNDLHQLERALDGKIGGAYTKGNVPLADAYKAVREQVRASITAKVPEYAETVAEYAAKSRLQEMLTKGIDTWSKIGVRELSENLAKLNPADAEQFRYGLASKLVDTLRDTNTNRNVAKQIMDKGISMQEKLKVIFGTPEKFDKFMKGVQAEKTMGESRQVVGGSQTAKRLSDSVFDPIPNTVGLGFGPVGIGRAVATKLLGKAARGRKTAVAQQVGDNMFLQGAEAVDSFLHKLSQPINILGSKAATGIGQGAGIISNKVASLFDHD
jgi:hypothetical protein